MFIKDKERGLSLIELMVVVAIIGILAAISIPRFQVFMGKARQAEAKTNLNAIHVLQETYYGDNDSYAELLMENPNLPFALNSGNNPNANDPVKACNFDFSSAAGGVGFNITDCRKMRYTYSSNLTADGNNFVATASTVNFFGELIGNIFDFINGLRENFGLAPINFPPATQNQINPECEDFDVWTIDNEKKIENVSDGVLSCS